VGKSTEFDSQSSAPRHVADNKWSVRPSNAD
jgi:hypothetical protein